MSQVTITDLVELVKLIEHQKGKHIKATLTALERAGKLDANTRKIVLDGLNNYTRSIFRIMNYSVED